MHVGSLLAKLYGDGKANDAHRRLLPELHLGERARREVHI